MPVTTVRPSAPAVDEVTTGDWARMFNSGNRGSPGHRRGTGGADTVAEPDVAATATDRTSSEAASDQSPATPTAPITTVLGNEVQHDAAASLPGDSERRRYLMDGAQWVPGDFAAIPPAPLHEAIDGHPIRARAIDGWVPRLLYGCYAASAATIGWALNIVSWTAAKLSTLINDPRSQRPSSTAETIALHTKRATNLPFTPLKVLYCGYAAVATPLAVLLNAVAWLAAHSAVALNDPKRFWRVAQGVLFVAIVLGVGATVVL